MTGVATLIGRVFLALIFVMAGLSKVGDFSGIQQNMEAMWPYWMGMTPLFLIVVTVVEIFGGLSVAIGYQARLGALLLFLFMIPTTLIFHGNYSDPAQLIHLMKNLAIMGGLLYVAACGPGTLSVDHQLGKT